MIKEFVLKLWNHKAVASVLVFAIAFTFLLSNADIDNKISNSISKKSADESNAVMAVSNSDGYEMLAINPSTLNGSTVWGIGDDNNYKLDNDGGFYSSAYQTTGCLPDVGTISVGNVPYKFTWTGNYPYSGNDSIRLSAASNVGITSKTMELYTYGAYDVIYVLGTAAGFSDNNQSLSFTVTLNYTTGSSTTATYSLGDWYRDSAIDNSITLYTGLYRKDAKGGNGYTVKGHGPRLQSKAIDCDGTRLLKSIDFKMNTTTQSNGGTTYYLYAGIYAVTGKVSSDAPDAPTLLTVTDSDTTATSFTAKWNEVSDATVYYLDVATDSEFKNMVSGYNNKNIGNVTEYKVTGLEPGQTYYYRLRSALAANSAQSSSSTVKSVTPQYKKLGTPSLSCVNNVTVGEDTFYQAVKWSSIDNALSYGWSVDVTDSNGITNTYSGTSEQTSSTDSAYVVTDGTMYWLNISNLVDDKGDYTVKVWANPADGDDVYSRSDDATATMNIIYPQVTVDLSDAIKASGISGFGGNYNLSLNNGLITLTAIPQNDISEVEAWYKNDVQMSNGDVITLAAQTGYDTYKLVFDVKDVKFELVNDGNGNYTLIVKETVALEEDITFSKDITVEMNDNSITGSDTANLIVDDCTVIFDGGILSDGNDGSAVVVETINRGTVIITETSTLKGVIGGDAEVSWTDENGDTHYETLDAALSDSSDKEIVLLSDLTLDSNVTLPANMTLNIPENITLTIPSEYTLDNNGEILTSGTLVVESELESEVSWTDGDTIHYGSLADALESAGTGETITLLEDKSWTDDSPLVIPENVKLVIPDGVVLTVDEDNIENSDNIQAETYFQYETDSGEKSPLSFGSFKDAVEAAKTTSDNVEIVLREDMIFDTNVEIPSNSTLVIPEDVSLTIDDTATLENNGQIVVEGQMDIKGTVDNIGTIEVQDGIINNDVSGNPISSEAKLITQDGKVYYGDLADVLDMASPNDEVTLVDDVVLGEDITVPENITLIVPEDKTLTVSNDVELINNGTIDNKNDIIVKGGTLINQGEIEGAGTLLNTTGGTLDLTEGITTNNIQTDNADTKSEATWTIGNVIYHGSFEEALQAVSNSGGGDIIVDTEKLVIEEDTEIPEGVVLVLPEKSSVVVSSGVSLKNNGIIKSKGGKVETEGTGTFDTDVSWTDSQGNTSYGDIQDALDSLESTSEIKNITILNDATLPGSENAESVSEVVIPKDVEFVVANDAKLTIPTNVELVNQGTLVVQGEVEGDGTIDNSSGEIDIADGLIDSEFTEGKEGNLQDVVLVETVSGSYYTSLEQAFKSPTLQKVTLLSNTKLESDITVPENITLVVPEGVQLVVPSDVKFENKGVIVNDGIIDAKGDFVDNGTVTGTGKIERPPVANTVDISDNGADNKNSLDDNSQSKEDQNKPVNINNADDSDDLNQDENSGFSWWMIPIVIFATVFIIFIIVKVIKEDGSEFVY